MKKSLFLIPAAAALSLPAAAVVRTVLTPNKRSDYAAPEAGDYALELARKLSEMVRYETVSHANVAEAEKFLGFHKVLEGCFRLCMKSLKRPSLTAICCLNGRAPATACRYCS